jgi:hypothetical protein
MPAPLPAWPISKRTGPEAERLRRTFNETAGHKGQTLRRQSFCPRLPLAALLHQLARLARVKIRDADIVDHVIAKQALFNEIF